MTEVSKMGVKLRPRILHTPAWTALSPLASPTKYQCLYILGSMYTYIYINLFICLVHTDLVLMSILIPGEELLVWKEPVEGGGARGTNRKKSFLSKP